MKNILIIGEYYSENLGDPLLCHTVSNLIEEKFSETNLIPFDLSGKISKDTYFQVSPQKQLWRSRLLRLFAALIPKSPFFREFQRCGLRAFRVVDNLKQVLKTESIDCALFAGGSLFMDYFAIPIYCVVGLLQKKGVKVAFHACGLSTLSDNSIYLIKKALQNMNVVSVSLRDSYQRYDSLFGAIKKGDRTYDTALVCSRFFSKSNAFSADFGIGLMKLPEYHDTQMELVKELLNSNINWKLFCNGYTEDYRYMDRLLSDLGLSKAERAKRLLPRPTSHEELIKQITGFRYIISYRMHSQIVACSYGIPSVGFIWNSKITDLFDNLGLSNNCAFPDQYHSPDLLCRTAVDTDIVELAKSVEAAGQHSIGNLYDQVNSLL